MVLGATMKLGVGRGSQHGEEEPPHIVESEIQPLSTKLAGDKRYYRACQAVLLQGLIVLCTPLRYYRKAGLDQPGKVVDR